METWVPGFQGQPAGDLPGNRLDFHCLHGIISFTSKVDIIPIDHINPWPIEEGVLYEK